MVQNIDDIEAIYSGRVVLREKHMEHLAVLYLELMSLYGSWELKTSIPWTILLNKMLPGKSTNCYSECLGTFHCNREL